jgi:hypothetical protein
MTSAERFTVHPRIVSETIDGEVIILNLERGRYYSLTQAGADAWEAVGRGTTAEELIDQLLDRYEGGRSDVEAAVRGLLAELRQEELILPGAPESGTPPASGLDRAVQSGGRASRKAFERPVLQTYTDMEDLLLLDPIHEVDETGWPNRPADGLQSPR